MAKHNLIPGTKVATHVSHPASEGQDQAPATASYQAPQLFVMGGAVDLVQSYSYGAYEDSYTRYKWNR